MGLLRISEYHERPVTTDFNRMTTNTFIGQSKYYDKKRDPVPSLENEKDDDPFFEIYNCMKLTFLEKRIKNPICSPNEVEFQKVDIEEQSKRHIYELT